MSVSARKQVFKFTYDDYRTAPPDERYELLDGELVSAPAPRLDHQLLQSLLGAELVRFVKERGLGWVFHAPCDVVLSDTVVVQPDLLFVATGRAHILRGGDNVRGAPDLVVEILSLATATRGRGYKRSLYARHGVKEYWRVDPDARTAWIHLLRDGSLEVARTHGEEQTLRSPTLDGFGVDMAEILRL